MALGGWWEKERALQEWGLTRAKRRGENALCAHEMGDSIGLWPRVLEGGERSAQEGHVG